MAVRRNEQTLHNASASVTLNASGTGTVRLGPGSGPAYWGVTGMIVQTSRPALAPIPRFQVYLNEASAAFSQGVTYDGSFGSAKTDAEIVLTRGQQLVCVWTGGLAGDIATVVLSGTTWSN
jgi:hypothetical protein